MKQYFVVNENSTELTHIGIIGAETTAELNNKVREMLSEQYYLSEDDAFDVVFDELDIAIVSGTHSGSFVFDADVTEDGETETKSIEIIRSYLI